MKNNLSVVFIILLAVVFIVLSACDGVNTSGFKVPVSQERYDLPPIRWYVVDTEEELRKYAGDQVAEHGSLAGFAGVLPDGTNVVVTLRPKRVDDDATTTLGHEVMHVALGDYHR